MKRKPNILVVGSFVMDVIATTNLVPGRGEAVYGLSFSTACGGKGVNQATQCACLGANVTIVGCVGDDAFGAELLQAVQEKHINTDHVRTVPGVTTGVGHITLEISDSGTQNRIVVIPGANLSVTLEDVAWLEQGISQFDAVLLQLEIPREVNLAVARWAHQAGVTVLLNPAPATDLDDALLPYVTYLIPNEQEASQETGLPLGVTAQGVDHGDLQAIIAAFQSRGASNVLITLGEHGSLLCDIHGTTTKVDSVPMATVMDPTGAGDSFVAALATGLSMGLPQTQALSLATHTAALTVTTLGAMPSLPSGAQVQELLQERKADPIIVQALA